MCSKWRKTCILMRNRHIFLHWRILLIMKSQQGNNIDFFAVSPLGLMDKMRSRNGVNRKISTKSNLYHGCVERILAKALRASPSMPKRKPLTVATSRLRNPEGAFINNRRHILRPCDILSFQPFALLLCLRKSAKGSRSPAPAGYACMQSTPSA